mgnify:CR=1 FL=1
MKSKISIVALIGICILIHGCGNAEEKKAMGPEEVAESFCRAVAGGEFGQAWALCDTVAMKGYIDGQKEAWAMLEKQDKFDREVKSIVSGSNQSTAKADKRS